MKKLYFSTFVEGLEKPIEAMLHKEGGVAVERVLSGAALYRSVREPALPYVHQTFQVLFQMKPMANVNDAVRRLLATGGWLDRFPYEETQGKKFRIVTAQDDHLVSANMRYVDMLETAICEHTGMHTYRERPEVELWAFLAHCGAKNAAILACTGSALPAAVKASGVRALTCICPDRATARLIESKVSGTRAYEGSSGYTDLADSSQSAVLMYLPVKAEKTERLESDLRNALFEARRVLEPEGRIVVIAALAHAESTLRKTQGVRVLGRYPLTLSGQKSAIWVMETTPVNDEA